MNRAPASPESSSVGTARRRPVARGFTLIEVLAALVIVALGMLGAIQAVNQSARNGTYLREKTLAHWIGMNVVTERRLQQSPPDIAESVGEVEFGGERWRWSMKVTQTAVESMRRMDVSVRLASAPENSSLATVSGFYGSAVGAAGGMDVAWGGTGTSNGDGQDGQDGNTNEGDDSHNQGSTDAGGNRPQPRPPPSDVDE